METGRKPRLFIIENHDLVRQALANRLAATPELELVGATGDYEQAVPLALRHAPDVILLEVKAPEGIATLTQLRAILPGCALLVLTSYPDSREEDDARARGADGYLLKTLDTHALLAAILNAMPSARHEALRQKLPENTVPQQPSPRREP